MACTAGSRSVDASSSDSDITGVTDLTEMEAALGLNHDFKGPDGKWSRGDETLKNGPCYQKLMTGAEGASYQFRRYSNGAAFFKKLGAGAASGDERPVVCVDVDIFDQFSGSDQAQTISLSDFEVDSVVRYRFGAPQGTEGAAGSSYANFEGATIHYSNYYCALDGAAWTFEPAAQSELTKWCFSGMQFPGSQGEIEGHALLVVYQYALARSSESNRFSSQADPVGRFVSVQGGYDAAEQIVKYEKLDLHILRQGDLSRYVLTPHEAPAASKIYECSTTVENENVVAHCD